MAKRKNVERGLTKRWN